jgi:hypothetical protein
MSEITELDRLKQLETYKHTLAKELEEHKTKLTKELEERRLETEKPGLRDLLRTHLRQSLPEHMIPAQIVFLGELPLTANGKLDRRALPEPDALPVTDSYVAPRDPTEGILADIWAEVLGVEPSASYSPRRWCPGYGGLSKVSGYRSWCYSTRPRSLTSHRQFES